MTFMTRTGTQLSVPLWRASGACCPTPRVPLACPQLAWDASHIWPGPQTIMCADRSQEDSAPFKGDCGSCWAEAGDSLHRALNSETRPGLRVPMYGAPCHPHFPCLMPRGHGPRGHHRASGGGRRDNFHAPGRPRNCSKPWTLPLLPRAGTGSPGSPPRPLTCSVTWGKLLSLSELLTSPINQGWLPARISQAAGIRATSPHLMPWKCHHVLTRHRAWTVISGLGYITGPL